MIRLNMKGNGAVRRHPVDPTFGKEGVRRLGFVFWLAIHIGKNLDRSTTGEIPPEAGNRDYGDTQSSKKGQEGADKSLHWVTSDSGRAG